MKKLIIMLLLICFISNAFASDFLIDTAKKTEGEENERLSEVAAVAVLPSSLKSIEEGAFEETNLQHFHLPGSLEEIGNRAFANDLLLRSVYIPAGTKIIGDDAFENDNVMILGESGSYAERWAYAHGISFRVNYAFISSSDALRKYAGKGMDLIPYFLLSMILLLLDGLKKRKPIFLRIADRSNMPPKDRPELRAIDYSFP